MPHSTKSGRTPAEKALSALHESPIRRNLRKFRSLLGSTRSKGATFLERLKSPHTNYELQGKLDALDHDANELRKIAEQDPQDDEKRTAFRDARKEAREFGNKYHMSSKFTDCDYGFDDDDDDDDETEDEEELSTDPPEDVTVEGPDERTEALIKEFEAQRNISAGLVHSRWGLTGSEKEMEEAANIANCLHRDYLALVLPTGREASSLPHKVIDDSAPADYQKKAKRVSELRERKLRVDPATDDGRLYERLVSKTGDAEAKFADWARGKLAIVSEGDLNPQHYTFHPSDGVGERPHAGSAILGGEYAVSQLSRFQDQLESFNSEEACRAIDAERRKEAARGQGPDSSPEGQAAVVPYLQGPKAQDIGESIVAYRNYFLAAWLSPGCYLLLSTGEQSYWSRETLERSDLYNAGRQSSRMLHRYREQMFDRKTTLISGCRGIVGVAHKGCRTLDPDGGHKRIGDCMIEVEWDPETAEPLAESVVATEEGYFRTWEIRTDWRAFRGGKRADQEIYNFAKKHDLGLISKYRRLLQGS